MSVLTVPSPSGAFDGAVTLADIFRLHGPAFLERSGGSVLPSHAKVLRDVVRCRTSALGGQTFLCQGCGKTHYSYHSCNNRHCPACQNDNTTDWAEKQQDTLLPVSYFFATFTVPKELGGVAYAHQRVFYNALFRSSSKALLECSGNSRFVGGEVGFMGVLHTWTRDLHFHPHIHCVIPGGGILRDKETGDVSWVSTKTPDFLVHVTPLSRLFKAKLRDELRKSGFFQEIPASVWKKDKDWVVHIQPAGTGKEVVKYLAPYVFRTALSNKRIVGLKDGPLQNTRGYPDRPSETVRTYDSKDAQQNVTFKFKKRGSKKWSYQTLEAVEFIRRFMMHVLPKGLVKVRYYGFMAPNKRKDLARIKALLEEKTKKENPEEGKAVDVSTKEPEKESSRESSGSKKKPMTCPHCGGELIWVADIPRSRAPP